jgi:hypothetical protein
MTRYNGTKRFPNIKKINTKILQSIVDGSDGRTEAGSDYGVLLDDIINELHNRKNAQAIKEQRQFEKDQQAHLLATEGKQCTHCRIVYPLNTVGDNFYKVANAPHRYRPRCKACHVKASRINRIKIEEIPF